MCFPGTHILNCGSGTSLPCVTTSVQFLALTIRKKGKKGYGRTFRRDGILHSRTSWIKDSVIKKTKSRGYSCTCKIDSHLTLIIQNTEKQKKCAKLGTLLAHGFWSVFNWAPPTSVLAFILISGKPVKECPGVSRRGRRRQGPEQSYAMVETPGKSWSAKSGAQRHQIRCKFSILWFSLVLRCRIHTANV